MDTETYLFSWQSKPNPLFPRFDRTCMTQLEDTARETQDHNEFPAPRFPSLY